MNTELSKFCSSGDLEGVKRLIRSGANVNIGDYDSRTPIHFAASHGQLEVIKFLI